MMKRPNDTCKEHQVLLKGLVSSNEYMRIFGTTGGLLEGEDEQSKSSSCVLPSHIEEMEVSRGGTVLKCLLRKHQLTWFMMCWSSTQRFIHHQTP